MKNVKDSIIERELSSFFEGQGTTLANFLANVEKFNDEWDTLMSIDEWGLKKFGETPLNSSFIDKAFVWVDTSEGRAFWRRVNMAWKSSRHLVRIGSRRGRAQECVLFQYNGRNCGMNNIHECRWII